MNREQVLPPGESGAKGALNELFLLRLRYSEHGLVEMRRDKPFVLDDPQVVWVVYSGSVDIFMVELRDGQPAGARRHLWRAQAGDGLFGLDLAQCDTGLLVVGNQNNQLIKVRRSRLREMAGSSEPESTSELLADWVAALSKSIVTDLVLRSCQPISPGQPIDLAAGASGMPRRQVVWVRAVPPAASPESAGPSTAETCLFCDQPLAGLWQADEYLPLSRHTWLQAGQPVRLAALDTTHWLEANPAWAGLNGFHRLAAVMLSANRRKLEQAERQQQKKQALATHSALANVLNEMAALLEGGRWRTTTPEGDLGSLLKACRLVGEMQGIHMTAPSPAEIERQKHDLLAAVVHASRISMRPVYLEGAWWQQDHGPLLGHLRANGQPVALLPFRGGYRLVDPVSGRPEPVNAQSAGRLAELATMFYRALPERPLGAGDLVRYGLAGLRLEGGMALGTAAAASLLALFVPLATGWLFSLAIPNHDTNLLMLVSLGWLCSALAGAIFQLISGLAQLRMQGKMELALEAAQWQRLLALPARFFRQFSSGDLMNRAFSIKAIRRTLTGAAINAFLAGLFSIFSLVMMFFYDTRLALLALLLALAALGINAWVAVQQGHSRRVELDWEGKLTALVQQLLGGIAKLRVAGAEERAFVQWAGRFALQKQAAYRGRLAAAGLAVFNAAFSSFSLLTFFYLVTQRIESMPAADFLAFSSAFGQFQTALLGLGTVFASSQTIRLLFERARPIIEAVPEVEQDQSDPGELSGQIEISHVSYRYSEDGPLVLNDLSLHIEPGEFVAIVGPSGSGKSTLFRLLLRFEQPLAGSIYYDGQDLAALNVAAVRRQIGTVLQTGRLIPGTIYTNIAGALPVPMSAAWEAARMASLSAYIESLPMGMHTLVSEGGATFSGGQRQRLMIARAVVDRPRILLFDEATSALDNEAQAIVSKNLENLQTTRIVIAHRLSTIAQADHIYVVQAGQIVQEGGYHELVKKQGPFAELVKRQM